MGLPNFLQVYLASYDISKLDPKSPAVAREVITQVLNGGSEKAIKWIFDNYTLDQIRECVKNPQRGTWFTRSINYWQTILKIKIPEAEYQKAIMNIYP